MLSRQYDNISGLHLLAKLMAPMLAVSKNQNTQHNQERNEL